MNSLAITDSLLLLVTIMIVASAKHSPSLRFSTAVFGAAALLGVLRFTGLLPLPQMHSFFSGLGATAAYPLLAARFLCGAVRRKSLREYFLRDCRGVWPCRERVGIYLLG